MRFTILLATSQTRVDQGLVDTLLCLSHVPVTMLSRTGDTQPVGMRRTRLASLYIPPLYILDSKARYPHNYKTDKRFTKRVAKAYGQYDSNCATWHALSLAIRRKGGIDASLCENMAEENSCCRTSTSGIVGHLFKPLLRSKKQDTFHD